ncbi:MAG: hypothetical protein AAGA08_10595 [Pseudomonadota bacterium]
MSGTTKQVNPFRLFVCVVVGAINIRLGFELYDGGFWSLLLGAVFTTGGAALIASAIFIAFRRSVRLDMTKND